MHAANRALLNWKKHSAPHSGDIAMPIRKRPGGILLGLVLAAGMAQAGKNK